jgi:hypothetical protein
MVQWLFIDAAQALRKAKSVHVKISTASMVDMLLDEDGLPGIVHIVLIE